MVVLEVEEEFVAKDWKLVIPSRLWQFARNRDIFNDMFADQYAAYQIWDYYLYDAMGFDPKLMVYSVY